MKKYPVVCAVILCFTALAAMASSVIGLSIEDQARLSNLVVAGKVVSQQGVIHPTNGIETRITLSVTEVFRGDVKPGAVVTFYTRGGRVGEEVSDAIGEAKLQTGQETLVFLESVDGRMYNLGLSMGVFNLRSDAGGRIVATRAVQEGLEVVGEVAVEYGPISLTDFAQRVDRARLEPAFEHPLLRENQRARLRSNVQ